MLAQPTSTYANAFTVTELCPTSQDAAIARFSVRCAVDPSALARIIELFVLRDLIPGAVRCSRTVDCLTIEVEVASLDTQVADHLVQRMRQMPVVVDAELVRSGG